MVSAMQNGLVSPLPRPSEAGILGRRYPLID
jgi:hypothetical protein